MLFWMLSRLVACEAPVWEHVHGVNLFLPVVTQGTFCPAPRGEGWGLGWDRTLQQVVTDL